MEWKNGVEPGGRHSRIDRLAAWIQRRRRLVLGGWVLAFMLATPFAQHQTDDLTHGGFVAAGTQSAVVDKALEDLSTRRDPPLGVLLQLHDGGSKQELAAATARARKVAAEVEDVELAPANPALAPRLEQLQLGFVPLRVSGGWDQRIDAATELRKRLDVGDGPRDGVEPYLVGQDGLWAAVQDVQKEQLASSEAIGLPITLIILLAAFGALAAAVLPFALAAISVTLTGAVIYFLSQAISVTVFVTNAASMIGIGVAIDYSLFVLARYRQEIRAGATPEQARAAALRTSGLAVAFSGLTVIVSLLGVFLADSAMLRSMALGMIVVVAISVLGALTLVPALITVLGHRVDRYGRISRVRDRIGGAIGARLARRRGDDSRDFWTRWTDRVMRRPVVSAVAAAAVMIAIAVPALFIEIGHTGSGQVPSDHESLRGIGIASQVAGPGALSPVQTLADFRDGQADSPANREALTRFAAGARSNPRVASVQPPRFTPDGHQALVSVVPRTGAESPETYELIRDLRSDGGRSSGLAAVATVSVGGDTALVEDFNGLVEDSMFTIALFVAVVSYLVLLVMLRSVVLALKAVFMTMLSVAAAYGALVAIFQWGAFDWLLGDSPGHVNSAVPPLLFAVTFGLSMDYEIFMLARIREYASRGVGDREAVARGLRDSAGTITGAAAIMVSVFAVFASVGAETVKHLGFGLAIAIALDATIVRLVLVPATMRLLGRWNWWLPSFLERRLPPLAFESPPAVAVVTADGGEHPLAAEAQQSRA
ncbi:MAG TPA: MMPL family transporter [Thermoleophilaceae bacterium]